MAFPNPSNYGTDPKDFSGRDYALGRHFFGDDGGMDDGSGDGGPGCVGCFAIAAVATVLCLVLIVVFGLITR